MTCLSVKLKEKWKAGLKSSNKATLRRRVRLKKYHKFSGPTENFLAEYTLFFEKIKNDSEMSSLRV